MKWTKHTPTDRGFYWLRPGPQSTAAPWIKPEIVEVQPSDEGRFAVYCIGSDVARYSNEMKDGAEWLGPIEPLETKE